MNEKKRLSNKGFSLIELIFVIAIMAILAGVLAPQYMKYLDRTRKASDVQTAQTIASAVNAALANEAANKDALTETENPKSYKLNGEILTGTSNAFKDEIRDILGTSAINPKYSPDVYKEFYVKVIKSATGSKTAEIYAGDPSGDHWKLYPSEEEATTAPAGGGGA